MQTKNHHALLICEDCLQMIANGEVADRGDIGQVPKDLQSADDAHLYNLPGDNQTNNAGSRHAARIEAHWPTVDGWHIVPGDSDDDRCFSWLSCDGCGSGLGGYRAAAHAFQAEVNG